MNMKEKSMTALISAFSRAYHFETAQVKRFSDPVAKLLFRPEEYRQICHHMSQGISFFNPAFSGTPEEALRWIVNNQLSPSPLGRSAFAESALKNAVDAGASQYLIFAAGLDTFAYRQPAWASNLRIFEIDHPISAQDKSRRLSEAGISIPENVHFIAADFEEENRIHPLTVCDAFDKRKISFCSLLGILYYLNQNTVHSLLTSLTPLLPKGSSLVFDYPDEGSYNENAGSRVKKQILLAAGAEEAMQSCWSYTQLERLLEESGFLIYEHLTPQQITQQYFSAYNKANPNRPMRAFDNVNYCLAVKK